MRDIIMFIILTCTSLFAMAGSVDHHHPKFANPDVRSNDNFVTIRAGSFQMGSPVSEANRDSDESLHEVTITKDFSIQTTVVTQAQYFLAIGCNPSHFQKRSYCGNDYVEINGASLCPNNPVEQVSWEDAQDFIAKLNLADSDYSYRLPTEAEWEFSARGGTQTAYWYGNDANRLGDYVWFNGSQTHAVGSKPANQYGLYDAQGNVGQWVQDLYVKDLGSSHQTDPVGATTGSLRVVRRSFWYDPAYNVRAASRHYGVPWERFYAYGFRLVRTAK